MDEYYKIKNEITAETVVTIRDIIKKYECDNVPVGVFIECFYAGVDFADRKSRDISERIMGM